MKWYPLVGLSVLPACVIATSMRWPAEWTRALYLRRAKEALLTGEDGASQAAPHGASSAARPPPATQCLLL